MDLGSPFFDIAETGGYRGREGLEGTAQDNNMIL